MGDEPKIVGGEEHPTELLVRKSNPGQRELQRMVVCDPYVIDSAGREEFGQKWLA